MTFSNVFSPQINFTNTLGAEDCLEGRFENDVDGNPLYIGYTPNINAGVSETVWFIMKLEYDATGIIRKRLPIDGIGYKYSWSARAFYFI